MRTGFVAILGQPNVGKSTFLNAILSKKVSIVSPKPQTTRDNILGVLTEKDYQMIFVDTPGLFESSLALDRFLNKQARRSLGDADVVLYFIDSSLDNTEENIATIKALNISQPLVIVLNKIDLQTAPEMEQKAGRYETEFPNATVFQMSALRNFGFKEIKELISSHLEEGPLYFPKEMITDKDRVFEIKEIIRQNILHFLKDEIPHQSAVIVNKYDDDGKNAKISAVIYVEKKNQVGIVVGKGGDMIKRISMTSRRELQKRWQEHVTLVIDVQYEPNWRSKSDKLRQFGYSKDAE